MFSSTQTMARLPLLVALSALVLPAIDLGAMVGLCRAAAIAGPRMIDARASPDFNATGLVKRDSNVRLTHYVAGL